MKADGQKTFAGGTVNDISTQTTQHIAYKSSCQLNCSRMFGMAYIFHIEFMDLSRKKATYTRREVIPLPIKCFLCYILQTSANPVWYEYSVD